MSAVRRVLLVSTVAAVALAGCTTDPKTVNPKTAGATASADPADPAEEVDPSASPETDTASAEAVAGPSRRALDTHLGDVKATPDDAFKVSGARVDDSGATHVRYTRSFHGLPVYGGDIVVHTDPAGGYRGVSNSLAEPLRLEIVPTVPASAALEAAKARFAGQVSRTGVPRLLVDASSGVGRLAWESLVIGTAKDGQTPSRLHVISDARSGAVLGSWDEIETVAGTGNSVYSGKVTVETTKFGRTYRLTDPAHGRNTTCDMQHRTTGSCTAITDEDNTWGTGAATDPQSAAVDAHYGAALTYDYYLKVHGRKGVFNTGRGVPSRVHFGDNYENAFWDGRQMTYGDGTGNAHPLVELDVAAHEMSHGVTENSVSGGLTYAGESGGLNESTSDIFGTMVEFYAANPADPGDYLIGEKLDLNGNGTPLRYMYNPSLDGNSASCWSPTVKDLDVHYSSGVASHFYFNLAEGTGKTAYGTSPICGNAGAVTGIGRAKAEKIWYRALDVYFTSSTSYVNAANPDNTARAATLHAAADMFGSCSAEYRAVQQAWTAVNVAGADAGC